MNGKRFQSTKIERALRFLHGPDRHAVGVDHGGFEAGMAQEFLNDADVVIGGWRREDGIVRKSNLHPSFHSGLIACSFIL